MNETYAMPNINMGDFKQAFKKLEKKAKKLGLEIPAYSVTGEEIRDLEVPVETFGPHGLQYDMKKVSTKVTLVQVTGPTPQVEGYLFVAKIMHEATDQGKNAVLARSSFEIPKLYWDIDPSCFHCGHNRQRKNTYLLLEEETKELRQVGSTCLKDFLPGKSPEAVANWFTFLAMAEDSFSGMESLGWGGGGIRRDYIEIKPILIWTAFVIREHGWMGRGKAYEEGGIASVDRALEEMNTYRASTPEKWKAGGIERRPSDQDRKRTKAVIEFARDWFENNEPDSDYEENLAIAIQAEAVMSSLIGVLASVFVWHDRKTATPFEKEGVDSQFQGEVKERLRGLELRLLFQTSFESMYGTTVLYKFADIAGNIFTWFSSGHCSRPDFEHGFGDNMVRYHNYGLEVGEEIILDGTVKKHEVYQDINQTILTRCKVKKMEHNIIDFNLYVAGSKEKMRGLK